MKEPRHFIIADFLSAIVGAALILLTIMLPVAALIGVVKLITWLVLC